MRLVHYLSIYLPSVAILWTFYLLIQIVLFIKRKDRILGTTFFKITFILGIAEMSELIAIHFFHLFPLNGILVDQIYLKWGAPFPALCNYVVIALGTVQYMLISVCSLNRFFVILGSTGTKKDFYDRITWILTFILTCISTLVYSDIFFTESMYLDFRNNETQTEDLTIVCRCVYTNDQLNNFNQIFLLVAKGSNVVFALAVYSCIFIMSTFTKRPTMSNENLNNRGREAKLAIAVFIHTVIAGSSLFLLIGIFYIWPQSFNILLNPIYILEDISRLFSPVLLYTFSRSLRVAFSQIYLSHIPIFKVKGSSVMVTKGSKLSNMKSIMQSNSHL